MEDAIKRERQIKSYKSGEAFKKLVNQAEIVTAAVGGVLSFVASLRADKTGMASKYHEHLIRLKCTVCSRINYYSRKNKKNTEKKLELKKFCKWCRGSTKHKEVKI